MNFKIKRINNASHIWNFEQVCEESNKDPWQIIQYLRRMYTNVRISIHHSTLVVILPNTKLTQEDTIYWLGIV